MKGLFREPRSKIGKGIAQVTVSGLAAVGVTYVLKLGQKNLSEGVIQAVKLAKNALVRH